MSVHEPELLDVDLDAPEQSRRPIVAGVAAGLWSLVVGVAVVTCLVMLAWAVSPNSTGDSAAAWRAAGSVWLGAHQVPLEIGGRSLTLLPLGALLLGLLLTRRSGRWAGRLLAGTTPGEAVRIVTACALVYGAGGAGIAWLAAGPGTGASPPSAFLWTAVVALVGATWGLAPEAELVSWVRARVSDAAWRTTMGGLAAVIGLLGTGGLLVTVSLVRNAGQIAATLADLDAGPVGQLALTVVGMLCLPTLDIWGMAVVVGPGFDLGSAGALTVFGGQIHSLPALPVLAAIPTTVPAWGPLLMLVPVALGGLAGRIRWGRDLPTLTGAAASGAGLAGVVAAVVGGLVLLASGSLGGGRLAEVGPSPLEVAGAAAGLVLVGFLAEAVFQSLRLSWELHQAERRAEDHRLRRAARGFADPAVPDADAEAVSGEGEDLATADEPSDPRPTRRSPRRQPPPVRESLVIPVVVASAPAGSRPEAEVGPPDTGTEDRAESGEEVPGEVVPEPGVPDGQATAAAATADVAPADLTTAAEPTAADLATAAEPTPDEAAEAPRPGEGAVTSAEWDPDSTVDLTVAADHLAQIRAALRHRGRGGATADGTSVGTD